MQIDDKLTSTLIADGWTPPIQWDDWRPALAAYDEARGYPALAKTYLDKEGDGKFRKPLSKSNKEDIAAIFAACALAPRSEA